MIEFIDVSMQYSPQEKPVLENFNLHVRPGEFVALTGKSGSGKTTLISLLTRQLLPTKGEIRVDGRDITLISDRDIPAYRRNIGIVFQDFKLIQDQTAFENVALSLLFAGGRNRDIERRTASVFSMLGITNLHKRYPSELSGGQQQKVCIARAIVNQPRLLLADEPTGNLDPAASEEIFSMFKLINSRGIAVVLATHDLERLKGLECRNICLDGKEEDDE